MDNGFRTYRLIKDTPSLKAGVVFQARNSVPAGRSIDGVEFRVLDPSSHRRQSNTSLPVSGRAYYYGADIQAAPEFFEEVFRVTPEYLTAKELKAKAKGDK